MQRKMLTDSEIYKVIPQFFTICNEEIEIIIKDDITIGEDDDMETRYGQWNEVNTTIELAKGVRINGDEEVTPVSLERLQSTFAHECAHCWQFFNGYPYDEQQAQLLANFFREYETSKKFKK